MSNSPLIDRLTHTYLGDCGRCSNAVEAAASIVSLTECVKVLREALDALFIQALQSDVNDASNDYGIEAIAKADAALSRAKELVP